MRWPQLKARDSLEVVIKVDTPTEPAPPPEVEDRLKDISRYEQSVKMSMARLNVLKEGRG